MSDDERGQFPLSPNELWKRVATKGDLATVLVALPIGFAGDLLLSMTGLVSPGALAVLTASGALGIKNGLQAAINSKKAINGHDKSRKGLNERAVAVRKLLQEMLGEPGAQSGLSEIDKTAAVHQIFVLDKELELFNRGISDRSTLDTAIEQTLDFYRRTVGLPVSKN